MVCLSAEVHICQRLAQLTNGSFSLAMDAAHFKELIAAHVVPPPELRNRTALTTRFVYLGFPKRLHDPYPSPAFVSNKASMHLGSTYQCPRCSTRDTQVPTQCNVCGLQLYSSSHIARSYHHMFPVPLFAEAVTLTGPEATTAAAAATEDGAPLKKPRRQQQDGRKAGSSSTAAKTSSAIPAPAPLRCGGCAEPLGFEHEPSPSKLRMQCPKCRLLFCVDCDLFIHDALHNCPGCC